jgi:hypothetical protein
MSNWRERLLFGIVRREWFRAETDEVITRCHDGLDRGLGGAAGVAGRLAN